MNNDIDFSDVLKCEVMDDGVAVVTLNRPAARNALSAQLRNDLSHCMAALSADDAVHAVLLTGAGDMFCTGFDLKELAAGDASKIFAAAQQYHSDIYRFPKPIVAAVNGDALAGGMDLAAMCDARIVSSAASFGQPQVKMGIPAAYDLLRTVMPEAAARWLCLTGERMDAATALSSGFATKVVADASLMTESRAIAASIAKNVSTEPTGVKSRFVAGQPPLFAK